MLDQFISGFEFGAIFWITANLTLYLYKRFNWLSCPLPLQSESITTQYTKELYLTELADSMLAGSTPSLLDGTSKPIQTQTPSSPIVEEQSHSPKTLGEVVTQKYGDVDCEWGSTRNMKTLLKEHGISVKKNWRKRDMEVACYDLLATIAPSYSPTERLPMM